MGWQIEYLRFDPAFAGCRDLVGNRVECAVTYGEDYFYSAVLGHNVACTATIRIGDDGSFVVTEWPFPEDVKEVELNLKTWIAANHPEAEAAMFGNDAYGIFRFSEQALRLHDDYRDEYLEYRQGLATEQPPVTLGSVS